MEKLAKLDYVKKKLIVGLALSAFGYTLSSIGVDEQVNKLMPRQQTLFYQSRLVNGQCLGASIGAVWASVFLIWTESTMASFIPFIGIAGFFVLVLITCLRDRLLPHPYYSLK